MSLNAKEEMWVRKQVMREDQQTASQSELIEALGGTTLRDNFAMAAMGIARLQEQWREEMPVSAGRIAARAYAIADAMMAARDK